MDSACPHPTWKAWESWAPSRWRAVRRRKLVSHGQQTGRRRMPDPHGGLIGYVLSILSLPDIWPPISDNIQTDVLGRYPAAEEELCTNMAHHGSCNNTLPHTLTAEAHDHYRGSLLAQVKHSSQGWRGLRSLWAKVAFCCSSALCGSVMSSYAALTRARGHGPPNLRISKPWAQIKPFSW